MPLVSPHDGVGTQPLRPRAARPADARRAARRTRRSTRPGSPTATASATRASTREDRAHAADGRARTARWREVDWETALEAAAEGLQKIVREPRRRPARLPRVADRRRSRSCICRRGSRAASAAATSTTGCVSVDFRDQAGDPLCTGARLRHRRARAGCERVLVVGSNLRQRCRCSRTACARRAVRRGAQVALHQSARAFDYLFPVAAESRRATGSAWRSTWPPCSRPRCASGQAGAAGRCRGARRHRRRCGAPSASRQRCSAASLRVVLLGALAQRHAAYCRAPCARRGARRGDGREARVTCRRAAMPSARPWPARCRIAAPAAAPSRSPGCPRVEMLERAAARLRAARWHRVRRTSRRRRASTRRCSRPTASSRSRPTRARSMLAQRARDPAGRQRSPRPRAPTSTSRAAGRAWPGAAQPPGEARPAWKILRVLGNLLEPARLRLPELRGGARRAPQGARRRRAPVGAPRAAGSRSVGSPRSTPDARSRASTSVDAVVRRSRAAAADA